MPEPVPVTWSNLFEGNTDTVATDSVIERIYVVDTGDSSDDETTVITALAGGLPEWFTKYGRAFYRENISTVEHLRAKLWKAKVTWTTKQKDKPVVEDSAPEITMSSGGGTTHITQSFLTVTKQPANAQDYDCIGFDGKDVKGVDIMSPSIEFSETYTRGQEWMTYEIIRALTINSGKVLSQSFRGFPVGEVLYKGCDISRPADGSGKVKFTYHFAVSPNATNIYIGSLPAIASKKGWDYLWIRYADEYNSTAKEVLKTPVAAYVEKVYEDVDMDTLYLTAESAWVYPPSGSP
jgi:hypothetical protein